MKIMGLNSSNLDEKVNNFLENCTKFNTEQHCKTVLELDQRPFVPSIEIQIFWYILFTSMVTLAVLGNLGVIKVILSKRVIKNKINIYLLNLSVADCVLAILNTMFNFIFLIKSHWPFGDFYCKINNFVANLAIAASVFTITVTTFDRYYAVLYPLRPRNQNQVFIVFLIWLVSSLISSPLLFYSTTHSYSFINNETRILCLIKWPDGYSNMSTYDAIYNSIFFFVTYAIPLIAMFFTHCRMLPVLRSQAIGEVCLSTQLVIIRKKHKAVVMLFSLTLVFAVCWLPYHLYFFYVCFWPMDTGHYYVQHLFLGFYLLAMSNSTFNPMIYCLMNKRFRSNLTGFFCCFQNKPTHQFTSRSDRTNFNTDAVI